MINFFYTFYFIKQKRIYYLYITYIVNYYNMISYIFVINYFNLKLNVKSFKSLMDNNYNKITKIVKIHFSDIV